MQKPSRVLVLADGKTLAALTALRIVVGGVMAAHGFQKLMDPSHSVQGFTQMGLPAPEFMVYLAIAGELLGGLGLVVGLLTPIAAFGVACTMLVAVGWVHLKNGLFAANGGFEYPLILLMCALWFMAAGAGPYSLDALIRAARGSGRAEPKVHERAVSPVSAAYDTPDAITESGHESFPASDPPAHTRHL